MKIPGNPMPSIQLGTSLSQDSIPSSSGGDGGGLQAMLSGAFEQCGIDQTTVQDYLGSVGIAKDSGMGMMSLKNAVSSFSSWMSSDSYINKDALMTLSHGLNGVALLAKTGGGMLGGPFGGEFGAGGEFGVEADEDAVPPLACRRDAWRLYVLAEAIRPGRSGPGLADLLAGDPAASAGAQASSTAATAASANAAAPSRARGVMRRSGGRRSRS